MMCNWRVGGGRERGSVVILMGSGLVGEAWEKSSR